MKRNPPGITAILLTFCVVFGASAQVAAQQSRNRGAAETPKPAIVVTSNRLLQNYATRRNGDLFTITIYEVGEPRTISYGQPFEQQLTAETDQLIISFQPLPGSNPQIEQSGNQLSIFFQSVSPRSTGMPAATFAPRMQPPGGRTTPPVVPSNPPGVPAPSNEPVVAIAAVNVDNYIDPTSSPGKCDIKEPNKENDRKAELVIIDANTGELLEGATRVSENTRVKVLFVNKNPFKYDYSFRMVPKDIGNTVIVSFLGLIPGLPNIPGFLEGTIKPATGPDEASKVRAEAAAPARPSQPGIAHARQPTECEVFAKKLDTALENSKKIADSLDASAKILKEASDGYKAFLENTNKTFTNSGGSHARNAFATDLCNEGLNVIPKLQKVTKFKVEDFAKDLKLDLFAAHVIVLENELGSRGCDAATQLRYKKIIEALKVDVANYKTRLEEIKKGFADSQKKLETPVKIIQSALGSTSTSFFEVAYAPSLGEATSVSISITRKNLRDEVPKDEIIAVSRPLQIGEPRIVLSGGIGFSSINERKIIRQPSLVPDGNGGMTLGNRFGFENRSQFRPSGVIMINGILKRFDLFGPGDSSFALSGGLVFSNRNEGLATEFIGGPSLGLANNRLFLTLGFHAARVEQLSGEFKIGDPVPANLADPLPVQKNWLNGLIMSLTFRIQP